MTRYRIDGNSAAVGIPFAVYLTVFGLLALWLYSLYQPQYIPNPGLAVSRPLTRSLARCRHDAEFERPAEEPTTAVVESKPEWRAALGSDYGARTSSPFCSRGGAARAAGVGLPLAYRRDDLDHHYRISLVDYGDGRA